MIPIKKRKMLKHRFRSLKNRQRFLSGLERKRRRRVRGFRLHQKLRIDLYNKKMIHNKRREDRKKKFLAKLETAKLNRTLKRRRKK